MRKHVPSGVLGGSLLLSLINCLASVFGLGPALAWATGVLFWPAVTIVLALAGVGVLLYSWSKSLLHNYAGMIIYAVNLLFATTKKEREANGVKVFQLPK